MSLYNPTLWTVQNESVEAMAKHTNNKLQARTSEPYKIMSVQNNTTTIDENGNTQNVSIDRVLHAPSSYPQLDRVITYAPSAFLLLNKVHDRADESAPTFCNKKSGQDVIPSVPTPRTKKPDKDTLSYNAYANKNMTHQRGN